MLKFLWPWGKTSFFTSPQYNPLFYFLLLSKSWYLKQLPDSCCSAFRKCWMTLQHEGSISSSPLYAHLCTIHINTRLSKPPAQIIYCVNEESQLPSLHPRHGQQRPYTFAVRGEGPESMQLSNAQLSPNFQFWKNSLGKMLLPRASNKR